MALLSKSMEGERTKQRGIPQGDADMGSLLVRAHRHKDLMNIQVSKDTKMMLRCEARVQKKKVVE